MCVLLTDSVVDEVLSDLSLEVLGQREGAHDPAVAVDHRARHPHALHGGEGSTLNDDYSPCGQRRVKKSEHIADCGSHIMYENRTLSIMHWMADPDESM